MHRIGHPTQAVICTHCRVRTINENDLIPIVFAVVCNEVGIEDFTIGEMLVCALLRDQTIILCENHRGAEVLGMASTIEVRTLVSACRNTLAHDKDALLGTIAERVGAIQTRRMSKPQGCWLATPSHQVLSPKLTQAFFGLFPQLSDLVIHSHNPDGSSSTFLKLAMLLSSMKLVLWAVLVVCMGILVTIIAIVTQGPEIAATPSQQLSAQASSSAIVSPASSQNNNLRAPQITVEEFPTPAESDDNVTHEACRALERRLLEALEEAQQTVNREHKEYEKAVESYEDALNAPTKDEQYLQVLRKEKELALDIYEDAQGDHSTATKRLTKARIECGLFR